MEDEDDWSSQKMNSAQNAQQQSQEIPAACDPVIDLLTKTH